MSVEAIIAAVIAGMIALDKAGYYRRRKNGGAAVTRADLAPIVVTLDKIEGKVDKHSERLAVVEGHVRFRANGSSQ